MLRRRWLQDLAEQCRGEPGVIVRDIVGAAGVLVVGAGAVAEGNRLNLGPISNPDSGFVIFWIGIIIGALGLAIIATALLRRPAEPGEEEVPSLYLSRTSPVLGALIAYALVLQWLGYLVATTLLLFAMFLVFTPGRFGRAAVAAVGATSVSYLLFAVSLGNYLPKGTLFGGFG